MIRYFFIYLAVINLIAFGLFAVDKKRAVYNGEEASVRWLECGFSGTRPNTGISFTECP